MTVTGDVKLYSTTESGVHRLKERKHKNKRKSLFFFSPRINQLFFSRIIQFILQTLQRPHSHGFTPSGSSFAVLNGANVVGGNRGSASTLASLNYPPPHPTDATPTPHSGHEPSKDQNQPPLNFNATSHIWPPNCSSMGSE